MAVPAPPMTGPAEHVERRDRLGGLLRSYPRAA